MSYPHRLRIYQAIQPFLRDYAQTLLEILQETHTPHAQNSNGVFFDLNDAPDSAIEAFDSFLSFKQNDVSESCHGSHEGDPPRH